MVKKLLLVLWRGLCVLVSVPVFIAMIAAFVVIGDDNSKLIESLFVALVWLVRGPLECRRMRAKYKADQVLKYAKRHQITSSSTPLLAPR